MKRHRFPRATATAVPDAPSVSTKARTFVITEAQLNALTGAVQGYVNGVKAMVQPLNNLGALDKQLIDALNGIGKSLVPSAPDAAPEPNG